MTMQALAIAAETQRRRIPTDLLLDFEEWTNAELAWFSTHGTNREKRTYAGWELEYREAFGIEVYIDAESGETNRRKTR